MTGILSRLSKLTEHPSTYVGTGTTRLAYRPAGLPTQQHSWCTHMAASRVAGVPVCMASSCAGMTDQA